LYDDAAPMNLPSTLRVKISSEAAEFISVTPVVVQEMKLEELVSAILSAVGKDAPRVREILSRGTQVVGGSRLRWDRIEVADADISRLLAKFPDPDPGRPFDPQRCEHFILRGAAVQIAINSESARRRRWLRSRSFWDAILSVAIGVTYAGYSYKECADHYRLALDGPRQHALKEAARLLPFSTLVRQIDASVLDSIDFFVKR
jgi:hypothetical protein